MRNNPPSAKEFQVKVLPNPASSVSSIQFTLKKPEKIRITLYDANGKAILRFINDQQFGTGMHNVQITNLSQLSNGVYYVRFETEVTKVIRKLVIVK
jgi:hypothetical protein